MATILVNSWKIDYSGCGDTAILLLKGHNTSLKKGAMVAIFILCCIFILLSLNNLFLLATSLANDKFELL